MNRRGFTIVELLIIVAVMGTLLVLGVVNLRGSQAHARDTERKTDVETLALHIERVYTSGNDFSSMPQGVYASTFTSSSANDYILLILRDMNIETILAPGINDTSYKTLISATNNVQTTAGVTPQPTIDQYVYQPIGPNGELCTPSVVAGCRKFNIYYHTEVDDAVHMITSKNQ